MEDSSLSYFDGDGDFPTEVQLEEEITSHLNRTEGLVLFHTSAQNIDRVVSLCCACQREPRLPGTPGGIRHGLFDEPKGNCWDNAPTESFFNSLKDERVHGTRYHTRTEAQADLFDYFEPFYAPQEVPLGDKTAGTGIPHSATPRRSSS